MVVYKKYRGWSEWGSFFALMMVFFMVTVSAPVFSEEYFVEYSISGQSCEIVSAVTPYDSNDKTRNVFLEWFKKGVETVLSEGPPLDIEWQQSPEGQAGQNGYETGLQEGEKCLKEIKNPGQPLRKTRKTPIEFINIFGFD